ncbi:MAG: YkgJ family cysteine cluster protein [Nanoarchaeota archaeon]|nr:YkgJ family cysteine cluster protein [Nanoarchaeota archaeon]
MDKQIIQFLKENIELLGTTAEKLLPLLKKEREENGIQGVVEFAYNYVEEIHKKVDMENKTTCHSGCSFCCYSDINITSFEASYILGVIEYFKIPLNTIKIEKQNAKSWHKLKYAEKGCSMLDSAGDCMIYKYRPLICRLWNSTSDPKLCDSREGYSKTGTARVVEAWAMSIALVELDAEEGEATRGIFLHKILKG